jgi:hypothetical protein
LFANSAINDSRVSVLAISGKFCGFIETSFKFLSGTFVWWTFAGNIGKISPARCISVHAIKQFDDKWETTNASIYNFFPLSVWMSKIAFPTHPRDRLFSAVIFSFPPGYIPFLLHQANCKNNSS